MKIKSGFISIAISTGLLAGPLLAQTTATIATSTGSQTTVGTVKSGTTVTHTVTKPAGSRAVVTHTKVKTKHVKKRHRHTHPVAVKKKTTTYSVNPPEVEVKVKQKN